MSVLDVRGVRKRFGDHDVLMGVDLVVDAHEAVVLIGASGSGKVDAAAHDQPDRAGRRDGQIFLSGDDITDHARTPTRCAAGSAWCSSTSTCSRTCA